MGWSTICSRLLVCLVIVQASLCSFAQNNHSDSVKIFSLLKQSDVLLDLAKHDSAMLYAKQALDLSRKQQYAKGEGWSLIKLGDILIADDQLKEATANAATITRIGRQLKDSTIVAVSLLHRAQIKLYEGDHDSAIHFFQASLTNKLEKERITYTALAYNDLGFTHGKKEQIEKLTEYCLKALAIYEELGDATGCAMALGNISTVYYNLEKMDKAVEYAKRSLVYREKAGNIDKLALACCNIANMLTRSNFEEAVKYSQLCEKYALQSGNEYRIRHSYITAGLIANGQKDVPKAMDYELKTISSLEKERDDLPMLSRRYIAAAFYTEMLKQDTGTTLEYFKKSITLSQQIGNKSNLRDAYRYMSDFYMRKKVFEEAYTNYKKHVLYKDSLAFQSQQQNIDELEKKYETAKKDVEIEKLNADQRIKQLEIEKQKAIINGNQLEAQQKENEISLLLQQRQLQDLKLNQQNQELQKQQLLAKNKEQELQIAQKEKLLNQSQLKTQKQLRNGIVAGSVLLLLIAAIAFSRYKLKKKLEQQTAMQEMRNHIASDLHDDIGASLSNINILNELTRRNSKNPEKVDEYLSKASEDIRQVSEGISDIVWNINPRYDNLGHLFVRMKRYASDILDGKNINYHIEFPENTGDLKLEMDKRRDLYLLFKEAVNNLAKYSKATDATIKLAMDQGQIRLVIQDNGTGFDLQQVKPGNGMQNMQQRAMLLKGALSIDSKPGAGTRLELEMPV